MRMDIRQWCNQSSSIRVLLAAERSIFPFPFVANRFYGETAKIKRRSNELGNCKRSMESESNTSSKDKETETPKLKLSDWIWVGLAVGIFAFIFLIILIYDIL